MNDRILVACPTHQRKEYAMQEWVDTVHRLTYRNIEILIVDNSPTDALVQHWQNVVPIIWLDPRGRCAMERINASLEKIRERFLAGHCSRWFSMEIDTIPEPADVIERLLELGRDTDWISHAYPSRSGNPDHDVQAGGLGCSLLSRRLLLAHSWRGAGAMAPDQWLAAYVLPMREFTAMELWGYFKIKHR